MYLSMWRFRHLCGHSIRIQMRSACGMPSLGTPFGGIKASSIKREFAPETIQRHQQQKSIYAIG
ncbi:hypothetical protein [Comamonas testosteroni]|uniref:hypothetical protein n=1 Tax=Comamonas testosteroni TaxID=285 RepID=UPI0026EAEEDC|nr:hypothetical protein [Comamonas testosteroni]